MRHRSGATRRRPRTASLEDRRRRRRRWTLALVLAGLTALGGWSARQLLDPARFPLRTVLFHGELKYLRTAELQPLVDDQLGCNFFRLDLAVLQQRLTADPWVAAVTIRRAWPDTLEVQLTERRPYAYWGTGALVDDQGRVFQPAAIPADRSWPRLAGQTGQAPEVIARYQAFSALLAPLGIAIERLVQDPRGAWTVDLASGLELRLGRNELDQRLRRFVILYPQTLRPRLTELAAVDLRYANGAALHWTELPDSAEALARDQDWPARRRETTPAT